MSERTVPMEVVKTAGENTKYQCVCGRQFWAGPSSSQNLYQHGDHTHPRCPSCKGVSAGMSFNEFKKKMGERTAQKEKPKNRIFGGPKAKTFQACVAFDGQKCKGSFIGEAASMAEFTMMVGAASMGLGMPMEGLDIKEVEEGQHDQMREDWTQANDVSEMQALMAMLLGSHMGSRIIH